MRATPLRLLCLATLLAASASALPQSSIPRPDGTSISTAQVDATVNQLLQAAHVTGAGIAILHNRRIVYLKAYGLRDTEHNLPLTPDSVMTSASLSKATFAVLVMSLVRDKVLDLDKPISQYLPKPLPEYPRYADLKGDPRWQKLTLRILLSHTSGFPNWRAFEDDHKLHIHFDPGTRYAYSGEGIDLAQLVVETVTGKSFTDLMQQRIFAPLHMTRTSMVWQPAFDSDFADGYDEYGRSLGPERRTHPDAAGSMQTTLRDYATFLSALLHSKPLGIPTTGQLFNRQIAIHSAHEFPSLSEETSAASDSIGLSYGLGWGIYFSPHGKAFFKEGHDDGWRHFALVFREHGDGILILTNSSNGEGIFQPLIDALLGPTNFPFEWENYTPYDRHPPLSKLKEHKPVTLTEAQLSRLAGKYAFSADLALTVTVENGHLFIQENDGPKQSYQPEGPTDFYSATSSDECTFKPSGPDPAQMLVLHLDGKDVELKRIP
jgi:CubicO group peptidase (beta-lactamase class C family)